MKPAENYSREPGFSLKDEVHEGDEVSATVVRKDDGQGNILLSRVEAVDVLAWDKLKELKESNLLTKRDFEMLVHTYTSVVNDWYANYCTAIGKTNGNAEDEEMIRMASSEYFTSKFIRK